MMDNMVYAELEAFHRDATQEAHGYVNKANIHNQQGARPRPKQSKPRKGKEVPITQWATEHGIGFASAVHATTGDFGTYMLIPMLQDPMPSGHNVN